MTNQEIVKSTRGKCINCGKRAGKFNIKGHCIKCGERILAKLEKQIGSGPTKAQPGSLHKIAVLRARVEKLTGGDDRLNPSRSSLFDEKDNIYDNDPDLYGPFVTESNLGIHR